MISESQKGLTVMRWRLILEQFGPNIQHIAAMDNVVADMLSQLLLANLDHDKLEPSNAQCHANDFISVKAKSTSDEVSPLMLSKVFN